MAEVRYDTRGKTVHAFTVLNAEQIEAGHLVGILNGFAQTWDDVANIRRSGGFALRTVTGDGSTQEVEVSSGVILEKVPVDGVDGFGKVTEQVFSPDGVTFTLTPTANAPAIGEVVKYWNDGNIADVLLYEYERKD